MGAAVATSDVVDSKGEQMADEQKDREGYGDDQGTRVGRPTSPDSRGSGTLGSGAEASEGIHGADGDRAHTDRSALEGKPTGTDAGGNRAGSEPASSHDREHESRYGGAGGHPKQS